VVSISPTYSTIPHSFGLVLVIIFSEVTSLCCFGSVLLSTHLRLNLPSGLFPSGFHTKNLYAFLFSPIRATWPAHLILRDLIVLIILGEEYKSWSSLLCNFLHSPVTSSLFGQNILLSTLFSNTLSLCSSLNIRDQVSQPYRTTGKIIVLYSNFFYSRREDKRFIYIYKIMS
jgi:hypothetical protein